MALTFTLVDDAGGRFKIVNNQLRTALPLDYEAAASHQVTIRATDSVTGRTKDQTLTITVNDKPEAAVWTLAVDKATINEGDPVTFTLTRAGAAIGSTPETLDVAFSGTAVDADFPEGHDQYLTALAASTPGLTYLTSPTKRLQFDSNFKATQLFLVRQPLIDSATESDETLAFAISNPSGGGSISGPSNQSTTIKNKAPASPNSTAFPKVTHKVAGKDPEVPVGTQVATAQLKNPSTTPLPAGVTIDNTYPNQYNSTAPNVLIEGWDFRGHRFNVNHPGWTFRDCLFDHGGAQPEWASYANRDYPAIITFFNGATTGNLVEFCTFDGGKQAPGASMAIASDSDPVAKTAPDVTIRRTKVVNMPSDGFNIKQGLIEENMVENNGYNQSVHLDCIEVYGSYGKGIIIRNNYLSATMPADALAVTGNSGGANASIRIYEDLGNHFEAPVEAYGNILRGGIHEMMTFAYNGGTTLSTGSGYAYTHDNWFGMESQSGPLNWITSTVVGFANAPPVGHYVQNNKELATGNALTNYNGTPATNDTTPNAFSFAAATGQAAGATVTSNSVTPTGYNASAPISVTGGQYSINGGAWTSTAGTINPGQSVQVRGTASSTSGGSASVVLNIGGTLGTFSITTASSGTASASTAYPGVPWKVVGTSLGYNGKFKNDIERGWIMPGTTRSGTPAEATANLPHISTAYSIDGQGRVFLPTLPANTVIQNFRLSPGQQIIGNPSQVGRVTLRSIFFDNATYNNYGAPDMVIEDSTFYQPETDGNQYNLDDTIVDATGGLQLFRTIVMNARGDLMKGKILKRVEECVLIGSGFASIDAHGDIVQYPPNQACVFIHNYINQNTPGHGETSVIRVQDAYQGAVEFTENFIVVDNTNAFSMFAQGGAGSFKAYRNAIAKGSNVADPINAPGADFTGSFLYNGGTSSSDMVQQPENHVWDNFKMARSGSAPGGWSWDGVSYWSGHDVANPLASTDDVTPDAFTFTAVTNAGLNSVQTSNTITVAGLSVPTPISITGGTYSKNGGSYTSSAGTVQNGDTVSVRVTASSANSATTSATLTIGTVSALYSVTTVAAVNANDTTPNTFSFTDATGQTAGAVVTSNTLTLAGTDAAAQISIVNGEYQIAGGGWTSQTGVIQPGQTFAVRGTASSTPGASVNVVLTIGGVSDTFTITTTGSSTVDFRFGTPALSVNGTGSGEALSITPAIPTGTKAGERMAMGIAWVDAENLPAISGWTLNRAKSHFGDVGIAVYERVAGGTAGQNTTDTAPTITRTSGVDAAQGTLAGAIVTLTGGAAAIDKSAQADGGSASSFKAPDLTAAAGGQNKRMLAFFAYARQADGTPTVALAAGSSGFTLQSNTGRDGDANRDHLVVVTQNGSAAPGSVVTGPTMNHSLSPEWVAISLLAY